jgi:hypothetical protein
MTGGREQAVNISQCAIIVALGHYNGISGWGCEFPKMLTFSSKWSSDVQNKSSVGVTAPNGPANYYG